eukprot:TRINITY_DN4884_c0_g1_i1.p1 TRINITY_DN4884_c0_g1~~TRINITY_DN4884_c0_g1_i1.p1  ORF type:complete len:146 (-),score=1.99 TRINITY_DN4884_c0_g1_i1:71-508(-)
MYAVGFELLFAICSFWGHWAVQNDGIGCKLNGLLVPSVEQCSVAMTFAISHHTYLLLRSKVPIEKCEKWLKWYFVLCAFCLLLNVIPATVGARIVDAGYWCWYEGTAYRLLYHIPVWIFMLTGLTLTTMVYVTYKKQLEKELVFI